MTRCPNHAQRTCLGFAQKWQADSPRHLVSQGGCDECRKCRSLVALDPRFLLHVSPLHRPARIPQRKVEKHRPQGQSSSPQERRIASKYKGSWTFYIPFGNPPTLCLTGFLVQDLINLHTQLKLSARPHNGMITCVLCVRDLTERLYNIVKQSLGFWQRKKEINMCLGEKNGSSWICRLDVIQSFSKNVLSLGQHTFIKCLLCGQASCYVLWARRCTRHIIYPWSWWRSPAEDTDTWQVILG